MQLTQIEAQASRLRWFPNAAGGAAEDRWVNTSGWMQLSGQRRRLSGVLPTRGSYRQVSLLLPRLSDALTEAGYPWELLVVAVDEPDTDSMPLQTWRRLPGVRLGVSGEPLSRSQALRAGFEQARGDAILVVDLGAARKLKSVPAMVSSWSAGGQVVLAEAGRAGCEQRSIESVVRQLDRRALDPSLGGVIDSDLYLFDRCVMTRLLEVPDGTCPSS